MPKTPSRKRVPGSNESVEVGQNETTMHAVDLFDRTNKKSVINLVTPAVQAKIFSATHDRPDLFRLPEKKLKKLVKPTPTESRLRLAFWNEFNLAMSMNTTMTMANVYTGICTQQFFDCNFLNEPLSVAWLLCPPADYIIALEEMLMQGQDRLRDILEADVVDEEGNVNMKLGELQLKIYQTIENRLKGSSVQRTLLQGEIRSVNANVNVNANAEITAAQAETAVKKMLGAESLAEIDEKLKTLRAKREQKNIAWTRPPSSTTTDGES